MWITIQVSDKAGAVGIGLPFRFLVNPAIFFVLTLQYELFFLILSKKKDNWRKDASVENE